MTAGLSEVGGITDPMETRLLLTGGTGHIGAALLQPLLSRPDRTVVALIRARDDEELQRRRLDMLRRAGMEDHPRVLAVRGDVSEPRLGLRGDEPALTGVDSLLHSAAAVRFDQPAEKASKANIESTLNVLDFARGLGSRLRRLDHISTCYVAGDRVGRVYEHECNLGQGFRNTYEQSKCEAETRVRAAQAEGLPVAIHRPSIVVGDSRTGKTESFNVLYWPLKLYARGWWRTLPGSTEALMDIVPVDYVADAIAKLSEDPASVGGCFHIAAGDDAPTIGALMEQVRELIGGPPLRALDQGRYRRFIRPLLWPFFLTKRGKMIKRGGEAFMPYFVANPLFDTTQARRLLGDLRPPPISQTLERIIRYAMQEDFGGR